MGPNAATGLCFHLPGNLHTKTSWYGRAVWDKLATYPIGVVTLSTWVRPGVTRVLVSSGQGK